MKNHPENESVLFSGTHAKIRILTPTEESSFSTGKVHGSNIPYRMTWRRLPRKLYRSSESSWSKGN